MNHIEKYLTYTQIQFYLLYINKINNLQLHQISNGTTTDEISADIDKIIYTEIHNNKQTLLLLLKNKIKELQDATSSAPQAALAAAPQAALAAAPQLAPLSQAHQQNP